MGKMRKINGVYHELTEKKFKWEDENVERLSRFWKFSLSI